MANTAWSTSRLINTTVAGLVATGTGVGCVCTADFQHSGKFYFEFTLNTLVNASSGIGLTTGGFTPSTFNASGGTPGVIINKSGNIFVNGTNTFTGIGALVSGNLVGVAVDLNLGVIWFRLGAAGNWNNNATYNPATGVGGTNLLPAGQGAGLNYYPVAFFNAAADQVTANFGDSAFTGVVPVGFTSGFTSGLAPVSVVVATQAALEEWASQGGTTGVSAQVTQAALEMWASAASTIPTQTIVTQMALEMWAPVIAAPPTFQARVMVMA